jgi:CheY-like chemotaxis protein
MVALVQALAPEFGRIVVHTAADGTAALALIEQHRPELVIAEVLLDGISGLALLRRVRRTGEQNVPAFVFVTTMVRESDRYWGLRNGAHGYVMKPYEDDLLQHKIRDVLGTDSSPERFGAL